MRLSLSAYAAILVLIFASCGFGQTCATGQCPAPQRPMVTYYAPAAVPPAYLAPQAQACPQGPIVAQHHGMAYSGHRGWFHGRLFGRFFRRH